MPFNPPKNPGVSMGSAKELPATKLVSRSTLGGRRSCRINQNPETPGKKACAAYVAETRSVSQQLLQQDQYRQAGDPIEIHDATIEQQPHHDPAAADAIGAVNQTHAQCTGVARAPVARDELDRSAAMTQARLLERGDLVEPGRDEQNAAEPSG